MVSQLVMGPLKTLRPAGARNWIPWPPALSKLEDTSKATEESFQGKSHSPAEYWWRSDGERGGECGVGGRKSQCCKENGIEERGWSQWKRLWRVLTIWNKRHYKGNLFPFFISLRVMLLSNWTLHNFLVSKWFAECNDNNYAHVLSHCKLNLQVQKYSKMLRDRCSDAWDLLKPQAVSVRMALTLKQP